MVTATDTVVPSTLLISSWPGFGVRTSIGPLGRSPHRGPPLVDALARPPAAVVRNPLDRGSGHHRQSGRECQLTHDALCADRRSEPEDPNHEREERTVQDDEGALPAFRSWPELLGRETECATLPRLLSAAKAGRSQVLVLRGEAGIGRTALLEFLVDRAVGCRVVRAVGVE